MGLDITLGTLILISAIRGWFKGFLKQAISLGSLVGCVYMADPLRELARPYAREYLPAVAPDILDRLLWWLLAVTSFLLTSGIGFSILKATKKKTYGEPEPNRTDQGAGFTLGALKGFVVASFLVAGVSRFAPGYLKPGGFAEDQTKTSRALEWAEKYRPAEKIWTSPPVQAFVAHVKRRGMWGDAGEKEPAIDKEKPATETAKPATADPERTASNANPPKTMALRPLDPNSPAFIREYEDEMRRVGIKPIPH